MSNENKGSGKLSAEEILDKFFTGTAARGHVKWDDAIKAIEYAAQQAPAGQECTKCEGTGMFNYDPALGEENDLCSDCHGSGRLQSQQPKADYSHSEEVHDLKCIIRSLEEKAKASFAGVSKTEIEGHLYKFLDYWDNMFNSDIDSTNGRLFIDGYINSIQSSEEQPTKNKL